MTGRWSSQVRKFELKDLQANAMAVDCSGQLVLLAGRRTLGLVNLTKCTDTPELRKIPRQSKWEVSACQWNPHKSHSHVFITACNQRADVWSWDDSKGTSTLSGTLKAHTRVISDLDWSSTDPNMVATCSGDAYAFLWDIRDTRKPAVSLQAVVGASQVKWNKVNAQLLATAHEGDIRIWDPRKGATPVQYIAAHLSKVHGLDWSPTSEGFVASSSQDGTVKLWNVMNPKSPEYRLNWSSPVWRARYTPSGDGLATVMVPQLRRGENSLLLWQLDDLRQPVHAFMGHQDVVLEFQWRHLSDDSGDYELVSWSRDQTLRLWKMDAPLKKSEIDIAADLDPTMNPLLEGIEQQGSHSIDIPQPADDDSFKSPTHRQNLLKVKDEFIMPVTPPSASFLQRESIQSPQQPKSLLHEFTLVNFSIPNVNVEGMDPTKRTFTASAHIGNNIVKLVMSFPDGYPSHQAPDFQFDDGTTVSQSVQDKLRKVLEDTSRQHVRNNRCCIEPCLRQLVSTLAAYTSEDTKSQESSIYMLPQSIQNQRYVSYYSYLNLNESVPYPRTCGARFCGAGFLVCFTKPVDATNVRRTSSSLEFTPRTMSSFGAYSQSSRSSQVPTTALRNINLYSMARSPPTTDGLLSFHRDHSYKENRKPRSRSKTRGRETLIAESRNQDLKKAKTGPVIIYNISCLMPLNQQLAENYVLDDTDIPATCKKNANAAAAINRKDLVQMWSLAALVTSNVLKPNPDPDKGAPWAVHPFGRKLFNSLIQYYSSIYDVQTLAMLCCVLGSKYDPQNPPPSPKVNKHPDAVHNGLATAGVFNINWNSPRPASNINATDQSLAGCDDSAAPESTSTAIPRMRRSSSWSSLSNDLSTSEKKDPQQKEREKHEQNMKLLDPSHISQYDQYKQTYADILYRWKLFNKRADVLKYVSTPAEQHKGLDFGAECQQCHQEVRGIQCCKKFILQCVICHVSVRGWSSFCLACGHGGHTAHMMEWFKSYEECPSGCGCLCLIDNPMLGGD